MAADLLDGLDYCLTADMIQAIGGLEHLLALCARAFRIRLEGWGSGDAVVAVD
jgi:hypothetical protein